MSTFLILVTFNINFVFSSSGIGNVSINYKQIYSHINYIIAFTSPLENHVDNLSLNCNSLYDNRRLSINNKHFLGVRDYASVCSEDSSTNIELQR